MGIFSAIIVVFPQIIPLRAAYQIDPVNQGIIFSRQLRAWLSKPSCWHESFLSSYRFRKPLQEGYCSNLPILLVLLMGVLVITYLPILTTFRPHKFGGAAF
jgi:C4-dicarboxylate transporter, DctM subunit